MRKLLYLCAALILFCSSAFSQSVFNPNQVRGAGNTGDIQTKGSNAQGTLGTAHINDAGTIPNTLDFTEQENHVNNALFGGGIPWYDVTASPFGAKPDGVTDATTAITNAAAAALANGGIVYIPPCQNGNRFITNLSAFSNSSGQQWLYVVDDCDLTITGGSIAGNNIYILGRASQFSSLSGQWSTQPHIDWVAQSNSIIPLQANGLQHAWFEGIGFFSGTGAPAAYLHTNTSNASGIVYITFKGDELYSQATSCATNPGLEVGPDAGHSTSTAGFGLALLGTAVECANSTTGAAIQLTNFSQFFDDGGLNTVNNGVVSISVNNNQQYNHFKFENLLSEGVCAASSTCDWLNLNTGTSGGTITAVEMDQVEVADPVGGSTVYLWGAYGTGNVYGVSVWGVNSSGTPPSTLVQADPASTADVFGYTPIQGSVHQNVNTSAGIVTTFGCDTNYGHSGRCYAGNANASGHGMEFDAPNNGGSIQIDQGADFTEISTPSNPSSGDDRIYLNNTSHLLTCLTSSGSSCMPGSFYQTVEQGGSAETQRPAINFINGANMTISCVDNSGSTRTDCTFTSSNTAATAFSAITAAVNSNTGNFIATGNTWDFSGTNSFSWPVIASYAPTTDGSVGTNSTTHLPVFGSNGNTLNYPSSITLVTNDFLTSFNNQTGVFTQAQPAFTNLSGSLACGQTPALTGDTTTFAGSCATTTGKVNGTTYPAGGSLTTNTVPVVTGASAVTYEAVPNAALANASITVNGQSCTLGSTCTIPFQVNTVGQTSQAGLNQITSTTNTIGLIDTPSNPGTNQVKHEITGTLTAGGGGTGLSNPTAHNILVAEGSSAMNPEAPGTAGNCLISNGATSDPTFQPCPSGFTNPMTTLGDIIYENATPAAARLAGPTTPNGVPQFLTDTPSGGAAQAEAWALAGVPIDAQTGTSYTIAVTDRASYVTFSNASAIAVTLPQAGSSGFTSNFVFIACDINTGTATITPTTSTISYTDGVTYTSGATSMPLAKPSCAWVYSDNTNYYAVLFSGNASKLNGTAFSGTNGDLVGFGASNIPVDTGIVYANVVTASGTLTNGELMLGNGSKTAQVGNLTGDVTTSGSTATTVTQIEGGSIPVSSFFVGTNSSKQLVANQPFVTNSQTTTYQVLAADFTACKTITIPSGTFTVTLVASGSQPAAGQCIWVINYGSGTITIARSGQNINGGTSSLSLGAASATSPTGAFVVSDGTNYEAQTFGASSGACGTCVTSAASLTSNQAVNGLGSQSSGTGFSDTAGTITSGHLACYTSSGTVGNCTGLSGIIGVFNSSTTWISSGELTVTLDATVNVTVGDNLCASPTSFGTAHDNGSTACTTALGIGIVKTAASSVSSATAFLALR